MSDLNRNARWGRLIGEELVRANVRYIVLCPGSRNSPLLFAFAAQFGARAISHIDERSAGFIAVGLARATGERIAVCVTSGSAVANLLPAICEADAAGLPIMVISADRPWEQHRVHAPQTMPQRGLFADFIRDSVALGEPSDDERSLRAVRQQVSRLAQITDGPTHLNVPLRDPLPPLADPTWSPPALSHDALHGHHGPYVLRYPPAQTPPLQRAAWMRPGLRGVIVLGAASDLTVTNCGIRELAQSTGFPVIADAPSHLRRPDTPQLITTADALVSGPLADVRPDIVIQVGPAPLARATWEWLDRARCPWIAFQQTRGEDSLARATISIESGWRAACQQLSEWLGHGDVAWTTRWTDAEAHARTALHRATEMSGWSESLAVRTALHHPGFGFVHLASSMSVRHANLHLGPDPRPIHSNRGVNGIDGTLGTFIGLARGHGKCGMALLGDLALLHDLPALAGAGVTRGAVVVLNNGGGGIFDYLPVAGVADYDRLVRTSHQVTFAGAATLFGLGYAACTSAAQLTAALAHSVADNRLHLIECHLQGLDAVTTHRHLIRACQGLASDNPSADS